MLLSDFSSHQQIDVKDNLDNANPGVSYFFVNRFLKCIIHSSTPSVALPIPFFQTRLSHNPIKVNIIPTARIL